MSGRRGALIGVAALAIGVSLAGPQAAGTANADRGGADSGETSSAPAQTGASRTAAAGPRRIATATRRPSKVRIFLSQPTESAPPAPRPVVTASAVVGSVSGTGVLGLLTDGRDGGPAAAPLTWTALAATRREIGAATRTASVTAEADRPVVQAVSLPRAGTYGTGTTMTFVVTFNEPVTVEVKNPEQRPLFLPVQVGFAMRNAMYISGSGTRSLTFQLTTTANDVGAIAIGRVSNQLVAGETAPVRIFDWQGVGHQQSAGEVFNAKIVDAQGNPASDTIPTLNTSAITVDARGPAVVSYGNNGAITNGSGPLGLMHWTTLTVNFDQPVQIKGAPTVPVTIGGVDDVLTYATGSGTSTLTFTKLSFGAAPGPAAFRAEGQIIDLPTGASITDKLGNGVALVLGDFGDGPGTLGPPIEEKGNHVVALGAHYQYLKTVTVDQLDEVLSTGTQDFYKETSANVWTPVDPPIDPASWWAGYQMPSFATADHAVNLYRVAYNSTIPEQGNRPTLAYGLVAIPVGATGPLPVVSYQHGAVIYKGTVPSQYSRSFETQLNVAQFGGQGYAVIAADYFGVGNSLENDGYISKASQQQACLDMYYASTKLLEAQGHPVSDLFLAGWSQGGLVTLDFLEKLQSLPTPITVTGAGTASAPGNVQLTSNAWYFNPRLYTDPNQPETPDDTGLSAVGTLSNFSITGYAGYPDSPLQMLGVNYEAARAVYMREFTQLLDRSPARGWSGFAVVRDYLDPVILPYSMQQLIAPQYIGTANEPAFAQTIYAQLLASSGAGQIYLNSPLQMWYGLQDQAIPTPAGIAVYDWQTSSFGSTTVTATAVPWGNHHGTFLYAVAGELGYFNGLRHKSAESL